MAIIEPEMRGRNPRILDCAVHPAPKAGDDLRAYMPEPWRSRPFPGLQRYFYPAPNGEADPQGATDPEQTAQDVLGSASAAILLPLTRGLLPDADLAAAICRATNDWLAAEWLTRPGFYGSIRISPADPAQAVAEIERWAGDPRMVQVAVTMQSHQPYGQRAFAPIWEAAARSSLPVAVQIDGGSGVEYQSTPVGEGHHYFEWSALYPLNFGVHLASLIAEGVFARLPDLQFVFADGGLDMLPPLQWRMDKNWRPTRHEIPWVDRTPSAYLREHVRFLTRRREGPADAATRGRWLQLADAGNLLLYGSGYPGWDQCDPAAATLGADAEMSAQILGASARAWYRRLAV
ncbi:MAG TPA: amidohydrolase family protein [Bacillota bacterium]|nr:amidohydrolase family protein [Bacillota bacterium]